MRVEVETATEGGGGLWPRGEEKLRGRQLDFARKEKEAQVMRLERLIYRTGKRRISETHCLTSLAV